MGPLVYLLGVPRVVLHDGMAVELRGHKTWGLLAFLVSQRGPVSRQHLARLLFENAEDPLAALRWNLSELRRALGPESLRGDAIGLQRDSLGFVDVDVLLRGSSADGVRLANLGRDLLEGLSFPSSPSFDVWLQAERRRIEATSRAVLHEAALARLAAADRDGAVELAGRLLALDPLAEAAHVLLVRCLAAAGDGVGAARQVAACRQLFQRELGVQPGPALAAALHTMTATAVARPATGRAGVLAQLEAGEAAIGAGALEAGLQCLRRAIADADLAGDLTLRTRTRVAFGGALVHAARGRDGEGAAALHEALAIGRVAAPASSAAACRELGHVDFLLGHYERALAWADQGEQLAGDNLAERARIATLQGSILSDMAYCDAAIEHLQLGRTHAEGAVDAGQRIYAETMLARTFLLTGRMDEASALLERCVDHARRMWTAFLPWPQSLRAEIDLLGGRIDEAADRFEHAFALGCELGDPCWEGIAGRGLGLVAAARGEPSRGIAILLDALGRCGRLPDAYIWGRAYVLDSLCRLAIEHGDPRAGAWADELIGVTWRAGMRELLARAQHHQGRLGKPGAADAARLLASEVRNEVLSKAMS